MSVNSVTPGRDSLYLGSYSSGVGVRCADPDSFRAEKAQTTTADVYIIMLALQLLISSNIQGQEQVTNTYHGNGDG